MATSLGDLQENPSDEEIRVLLIEEPEAHLHPQLLELLFDFFRKANTDSKIQIFMTSHSPSLVAKADLDDIHIITSSKLGKKEITSIKDSSLDVNLKNDLKRYLDVTKSQMLFAKVIKTKTRVKDNNLKDFNDQPIKNLFAGSSEEHYTNSTIHSVKGCTFEAVMLIISSSGKLTENMINTKPIDSEEIRTFYVAATRARKLFVLALPDKKKATMGTVRLPKELWNYKDGLI